MLVPKTWPVEQSDAAVRQWQETTVRPHWRAAAIVVGIVLTVVAAGRTGP